MNLDRMGPPSAPIMTPTAGIWLTSRINVTPMNVRRAIALAGLVAAGFPAFAQRTAVTANDYARAERFLPANVAGLVVGGSVSPNWLSDGRFWYRNQTPSGTEIVVV